MARRADVAVEGNVIAAIGKIRATGGDQEVDATGCWVIPGLVQTHVHLCQTLFRGVAEDLDVMQWLDRHIWPLEQLLDRESAAASARWGVAQLLLSGTTTFNSMETARHTDVAFEAAADLGARAVVGKALMDRQEPGTELWGESTGEAWADLERLVERWHGREGGRLQASVAPRAPSAASTVLMHEAVDLARRRQLVIHTHVNENRSQAALVAGVNDGRDVQVLKAFDALGPRSVLAHCVWLSDEELRLLATTRTNVAHCPSANLKLGSGIARVPEMLAVGVNVTIGTDGAACNNSLDAFDELRMAALVHRPRCGAAAMPAYRILELGTRQGAQALGWGDVLGELAVGRLADIAVVATPEAGVPSEAVRAATHLVFANSLNRRVEHVLVDGRLVVHHGELVHGSKSRIEADAFAARKPVLTRMRIERNGRCS
ncbi:N-ethylammeline chlorohydrolase [Kribbella turkmenica]|uniref:N-ethylammeline chlorohydrolase n=1 Tax=Kribbella turkmenica TaxID=2530375 RepID=A0A4R4XEQ6_9ACTN|nr:amidohydrolase family protein [Kribbella turkmenica]TDD29226.1 N-ethylammeline chlorohydrolase [Kribbella turkmenica]